MTVVEALILGLVQGLTEFLPISSSGHLELGSFFLGVKTKDNLLFAIIVHGATALSTTVVFRKEIMTLLTGLFQFRWNEETKYVARLLLSMVPVGIAGLLFEDQIEVFFGGNVVFVAFMLLITGILLTATHFVKDTEGSVTFPKAFMIGIVQSIAILPGISRSGATISASLLLGVEKSKATRFSFLMVLTPIAGAMLLKTMELLKNPGLASGIGAGTLLAGFIAAFLAGLLACNWMIRIVRKGNLFYFAIYCFVVAALVLIAYW